MTNLILKSKLSSFIYNVAKLRNGEVMIDSKKNSFFLSYTISQMNGLRIAKEITKTRKGEHTWLKGLLKIILSTTFTSCATKGVIIQQIKRWINLGQVKQIKDKECKRIVSQNICEFTRLGMFAYLDKQRSYS